MYEFLIAVNQLLARCNFVEKETKGMMDFLMDPKSRKAEAAEVRGEMEIVNKLTKQAIAQNTSMAMDQEEYTIRYNTLAERF